MFKLNAENKDGMTALMYAVSFGTPAVAHALLDAGADANAGNKNRVTALMVAAGKTDKKYKPEFVRLLLGAGADVRPKSIEGKTANQESCNSKS